MGYLIDAWKRSQEKFHMTLRQVVTSAGDGTLENDASKQELREFYTLIDLDTMNRLIDESISKDKKYKFDTRGFAFQDLVNEMGRRLGYEVENGLYRGKKNEVGFDGLWTAKDGSCIIMESKTNDDYSLSVKSVIGYRDKLIYDHKVPKKKCAILVVYGRDDRGALRNTVKGSDEAKNIRLISANALYQLVKIYTDTPTPTVEKQINNLLAPKDYFVLDNLVELVFPETDDDIAEIVDPEEDTENQGGNATKEDGFAKGSDSGDTTQPEGVEVFCEGASGSAHAKAILTAYNNKLKVLKGSRIAKSTSPSYSKSLASKRNELIADGTIQDYVFRKDWNDASASTTAGVVLGYGISGMVAWRTADGTKIGELKEKEWSS